ncbi:MAG: class I mannose-6-phosphate isomerase [Proteobacteria bacterium]|nr:class I mannose-6-phosphate isomerase [Pseudomonadota bacterium]
MSVVPPLRLVEKPWGSTRLPPPFVAPAGARIGEIWFEPPAMLSGLLAKYIFTSEALSVQVHPDDAQARASGAGPRGKEECWLVLAAEPGATLGIGLTASASRAELEAAAQDGSIAAMLAWHPVAPGDFFYIPAGTIHAIGAGVSLVEIQQNSDITYRLYDYGRPRELHLAEGLAVARGEPYPTDLHRRLPERGNLRLVDGPHFRLDRVEGAPDAEVLAAYAGAPVLVLPLAGSVTASGHTAAAGGCLIAESLADCCFAPGSQSLIAQPLER